MYVLIAFLMLLQIFYDKKLVHRILFGNVGFSQFVLARNKESPTMNRQLQHNK
jgi:hypothetical protein